jgi:putative transposase
MLAYWESAELAEKLIEQTIERHNICPGTLTVHADRGAAMRSKVVAFFLAELGVTKSSPVAMDDFLHPLLVHPRFDPVTLPL